MAAEADQEEFDDELLRDVSFALRGAADDERGSAVETVRREQAIRKLAKVEREGVIGYRRLVEICVIEGVIPNDDGVLVKEIVRHICEILAREGQGGGWAFPMNPKHGTIVDPNKWDLATVGGTNRNSGRGGYQSALVSVELADALVGMIWQLTTRGRGAAGEREWGDIAHLIEKGCRSVFRDTAIPELAIYDKDKGKARGKARGVAVMVRVRLLTAGIMVAREHKGEAERARMLEVCTGVISEVHRLSGSKQA
ncbi:hypothetical protein TrCOL_g6621, partial [Triparma columacea]